MMRTATTILAVAFWCCLVAALARTPVDNLQSSAQTVEGPPNSCRLRSRQSRRSCRQHPTRPMQVSMFGSAHQNYGPIYRETGRGGAYRTTHQTTLGIATRSSGGARVTTGELRVCRVSRLAESAWTGQRHPCPPTPLQTPDGPTPRTRPLWFMGFLFRTLGCWKITGHDKGQELSYVVWVSK